MVQTLSDLLTEYLDETKDSTATNTARGKRRISRANDVVISNFPDAHWRKADLEIATIANTKDYILPVSVDKVESVFMKIDTTTYPVDEVDSSKVFDLYDRNITEQTSDIPTLYMIRNNTLRLYPTPATSDNTILVRYSKRAVPLVATDYTTGTISVANGSATVTGSGTSWTANARAGQFLIPTNGLYAYEILSVGGNTSITLVNKFAETTLSGSTYRIGDVSIIPQSYQDILWRGPSKDYWIKHQDANTATMHSNEYDRLYADLMAYSEDKGTSIVKNPRRRQSPYWILANQLIAETP